jgi:hypothetical protein
MTEKSIPKDKIASQELERESHRQAEHRGTPSQNDAIERRISEEMTADALARKRERDKLAEKPEL